METVTLGIFTGFMVVLWGMGMRMLSNEIKLAVSNIEMQKPELGISGEMKQELYDLLVLALDDTVGQMNIPTAKDHLLGGLMTIFQNKMMRSIPEPLANIIEDPPNSDNYGQA